MFYKWLIIVWAFVSDDKAVEWRIYVKSEEDEAILLVWSRWWICLPRHPFSLRSYEGALTTTSGIWETANIWKQQCCDAQRMINHPFSLRSSKTRWQQDLATEVLSLPTSAPMMTLPRDPFLSSIYDLIRTKACWGTLTVGLITTHHTHTTDTAGQLTLLDNWHCWTTSCMLEIWLLLGQF